MFSAKTVVGSSGTLPALRVPELARLAPGPLLSQGHQLPSQEALPSLEGKHLCRIKRLKDVREGSDMLGIPPASGTTDSSVGISTIDGG